MLICQSLILGDHAEFKLLPDPYALANTAFPSTSPSVYSTEGILQV